MSNDNKEHIQLEDRIIIRRVLEVLDSIESVSRLSGNLFDAFARNILGSDVTQGIDIDRDKKGITVNIHLIVVYGVNIPQLSYDIQMKIMNILEKKEGINIEAINIIVEGIDRK